MGIMYSSCAEILVKTKMENTNTQAYATKDSSVQKKISMTLSGISFMFYLPQEVVKTDYFL